MNILNSPNSNFVVNKNKQYVIISNLGEKIIYTENNMAALDTMRK